MMNAEWNDFFRIEEVYDSSDIISDPNATDSYHYEAARALACCMDTVGCVNLSWMSQHSGLSADQLTDALEGAIFQDPEAYDLHHEKGEDWFLRAQYLKGNLASKLDVAKRMNRKYKGRFDRNVTLLKKARPPKVPFEEIGISIGSSWIPEDFYALFVKELLGTKTIPRIMHVKELGEWKVEASDVTKNTFNNLYTYGYTYKNRGETKYITMLQILEHTLNGSTIKVHEEVLRPDRKSGVAKVLLKNETVAVQEKQELLQKVFKEWVGKDPKRRKRVEEIFYDTLVTNTVSHYDGGFLTLPDLNREFVPYPHQRNAVARIVLDKDVLLSHAVGSGKTNILIMGIHERFRMGLSKKNLVVVPNYVLEAFERAHKYLYPDDKILVITPEIFKPQDRNKILEKLRDGDYVAAYMAFSSFDMVQMSRQYHLDQKSEEIRMMRAQAATVSDKWEKKRFESKASKLSDELAKLRTELPADRYLPFDELGITTLVVDEVHHYKNISLKTSADGIVGMHTSGSKKCNELMDKAQYVRSHGGSIIFSTGTPLTNSISDLYVLQMYLQPEQMQLLGLSHFDEWVGTFGNRRAGFEIDVDSQSYRIMTRFSSFHNLPELTGLFASVCDSYNGSDSGIGLPESDGYIDTVIPKSPEQTEYIEELVLRTEMIRAKLVNGQEDNLLKVTHDGRAAALDIRLADATKIPDPRGTKVFACAQNVYQCLQDNPGTAQLVFCDLGTPKKGFNIYDELKEHLITMGVPTHQIAFVHDADTEAKRRKLFDAVNKAQIRVLIGSTSKLGTGVNVQENLIAIHHLDVPWKPSDMVQREGRLIRQGNNNKKVFRYRYITSGTFDAYSWQIVENKQRFIGQFMNGTLAQREIGDIDDAVLTYAEIKALSVGDPLLKTRIETNNELEKVKIQSRQREQELRKMEIFADESPRRLERFRQRKNRLETDLACFTENRENFSKQERLAFGEELLEALDANGNKTGERCFDSLHGFKVLLPGDMNAERPYILLLGETENRYRVEMKDAKEAGCMQRIEYVLQHLKDRITDTEEEIKKVKRELRQAKEELCKGNPYSFQVGALNQKLLEIDRELNRRAEESIA